MSQNAQVRASSTRWLIMTDTSACQVGVYSGSYGNWSRVALWSCGPGKPSTPTVKGSLQFMEEVNLLVAGLIHVGIIRSFMETICSIQCFIIVVV